MNVSKYSDFLFGKKIIAYQAISLFFIIILVGVICKKNKKCRCLNDKLLNRFPRWAFGFIALEKKFTPILLQVLRVVLKE